MAILPEINLMIQLGYIASIFIGISLGLIGGGGSILTVPVLVYLFGVNPVLSTSYSLFVVGSTSLVGAFRNYQKNLVSIKTTLLFGTFSMATVFIIRKWLQPLIPEHLFTVYNIPVTKSKITMLLFASIMILAALPMIKKSGKTIAESKSCERVKYPMLISYGVLVGLATGILGAGGGFLLIPALVLLVGMPMKRAVGTSLLIIALNSLMGFSGDIGHFKFDWIFLSVISAIAIAGIFIGEFLSMKIDGDKLKKGFGWFILSMGIYILVNEIFKY